MQNVLEKHVIGGSVWQKPFHLHCTTAYNLDRIPISNDDSSLIWLVVNEILPVEMHMVSASRVYCPITSGNGLGVIGGIGQEM